jgi:ATP-dependent protease ClpP protease subunit
MLHCNERVSTPYSEFVIHSGMVSQISIPIKPTSLEDLEQLLKEVKAAEERVIQLFNERLSAEEAVEVGLVTEIIGEKLDIYAE